MPFDRVEDAIEEIRQGRMAIVADELAAVSAGTGELPRGKTKPERQSATASR